MCIPFGVQTISRSRTLIIIFPDSRTTWSLAFWLIPVIPVIPVLCCFVVPRNFPADRIEAAIFKLRLQRMRGCLPTLVQKNCRHWCSEHFGNFSVEQSFQKEKHIQTFKIWKSTPDSIETKLKARSQPEHEILHSLNLGSWNRGSRNRGSRNPSGSLLPELCLQAFNFQSEPPELNFRSRKKSSSKPQLPKRNRLCWTNPFYTLHCGNNSLIFAPKNPRKKRGPSGHVGVLVFKFVFLGLQIQENIAQHTRFFLPSLAGSP